MPKAENLVGGFHFYPQSHLAAAVDIVKENIETRRHLPRISLRGKVRVRETVGTQEARLRFGLSGDNIDFRREFLRNGRRTRNPAIR